MDDIPTDDIPVNNNGTGGTTDDKVIDFNSWKSAKQNSGIDLDLKTNKPFVAGIVYLFDEDGDCHPFDFNATCADWAVAAMHSMLQSQSAFIDNGDDLDSPEED